MNYLDRLIARYHKQAERVAKKHGPDHPAALFYINAASKIRELRG